MQPTGKDSSSPLGVRFHFADLWIEELLKIGGSKTETPLDVAASAKFINCWVKVATLTNIGNTSHSLITLYLFRVKLERLF